MRLHIVARGKIGRSPEGELVDRYLKRITWPTKITEFAELLGRWRDDGVAEVRLCLGAADGFDDADRAAANKLIAFGKATWPHLMARAMLAEQLYRATSILANHPYHREG
jgi:23S rRNA (pseudouridine1915-N3)-methyltransferase